MMEGEHCQGESPVLAKARNYLLKQLLKWLELLIREASKLSLHLLL